MICTGVPGYGGKCGVSQSERKLRGGQLVTKKKDRTPNHTHVDYLTLISAKSRLG